MCDTRFNYQKMRRDRKGRFQPSRPKELRRGSLYQVQDTASTNSYLTARFRSNAYGDFAVFSVHGEPVVGKKSTVRFADKSAVDSYFGK